MNSPMFCANNAHYYIQLRRGNKSSNPLSHNPYGSYGYKNNTGPDTFPTPLGNNNQWEARDAVPEQSYIRHRGYPMNIIPAIYSKYGVLDMITQDR